MVTFWCAGAIWVDGFFEHNLSNQFLAVLWLILAFVCLALTWKWHWFIAVWFGLVVVVAIPWMMIEASNERDWKPEWRETAWIEVADGKLTFRNFRDFDYSLNGEISEFWREKTVTLSNLRGVDFFHVAFGGDLMAHPLLSFDFGSDGHVVLSIETRREMDEGFSEIGGLFKMFELQYLWGSERDLVRVRTNIRNEPTYLYKTAMDRERAFFILTDSIRATNQLRDKARFYNVITANCTTSLLSQSIELRDTPLDIRMLANGRFDELVFERGGFVTSSAIFEDARADAFINPTAQSAHDDTDFSARIRVGVPGFQTAAASKEELAGQ